jgi:hypothetical protein
MRCNYTKSWGREIENSWAALWMIGWVGRLGLFGMKMHYHRVIILDARGREAKADRATAFCITMKDAPTYLCQTSYPEHRYFFIYEWASACFCVDTPLGRRLSRKPGLFTYSYLHLCQAA